MIIRNMSLWNWINLLMEKKTSNKRITKGDEITEVKTSNSTPRKRLRKK